MKPPRSSTSEPNLAATPQTFHETRCLNLRLQVKMPLRLLEEIDGAGRRRHEIKEAFDLPLLVDGVLDFLLSSLMSLRPFAEPSDGLEPSTPSLPWSVGTALDNAPYLQFG